MNLRVVRDQATRDRLRDATGMGWMSAELSHLKAVAVEPAAVAAAVVVVVGATGPAVVVAADTAAVVAERHWNDQKLLDGQEERTTSGREIF